MVKTGKHLWARHPTVDNDLSFGEKAADFLKRWFGTWTALGAVASWIAVWILINYVGKKFDPYPFILLNLCLSCLAAVQGIILQISANRQDRINAQAELHSAEVATKTQENTDTLLTLQRQQMEVLAKLDHIDTQIDNVHTAICRQGDK